MGHVIVHVVRGVILHEVGFLALALEVLATFGELHLSVTNGQDSASMSVPAGHK